MATKRSEVVTFEGLSASLDKAFAVAGKRHGAEFEAGALAGERDTAFKTAGADGAGTLALNWEIFGRRIKSLDQPGASRLEVANTVISSMKLKGVQPAVIGFDKWILVGFWDPRIRDIEGIRTGPPSACCPARPPRCASPSSRKRRCKPSIGARTSATPTPLRSCGSGRGARRSGAATSTDIPASLASGCATISTRWWTTCRPACCARRAAGMPSAGPACACAARRSRPWCPRPARWRRSP